MIISFMKYTLKNTFSLQLATFMNPVSKEVREKIGKLVAEGVDTVGEMRRHLRLFIQNDLFKDQSKPSLTDNAYHPSSDAIRSHMYAAQLKLR